MINASTGRHTPLEGTSFALLAYIFLKFTPRYGHVFKKHYGILFPFEFFVLLLRWSPRSNSLPCSHRSNWLPCFHRRLVASLVSLLPSPLRPSVPAWRTNHKVFTPPLVDGLFFSLSTHTFPLPADPPIHFGADEASTSSNDHSNAIKSHSFLKIFHSHYILQASLRPSFHSTTLECSLPLFACRKLAT